MADSTQAREVLVLDTDPLTRAAVAEALEDCNPGYAVDYASDPTKLKHLLRRKRYWWVLVDADPSNGDLAGLANSIREASPETRSLLMTSSDLPDMRTKARESGFDAWLGKPFTMQAVRQALRCKPSAVHAPEPEIVFGEDSGRTRRTSLLASDSSASSLPAAVHESLERLLAETRAQAVLLITTDGYPVDAAGATQGLHLPTLGALMSANFAAAAELSRLLGNPSDFRASHHQGSHCHIYTYLAHEDLLLAVIFGQESRAGAVWLFAKRAGEDIAEELAVKPSLVELDQDLAPEVDAQLDELFEDAQSPVEAPDVSAR